MNMEFGWWSRDSEGRRFQMRAKVFADEITWSRKQGHFQSWVDCEPTDDDWETLISEASRRVPRRLITSKEFEALKRMKP